MSSCAIAVTVRVHLPDSCELKDSPEAIQSTNWIEVVFNPIQ